MYFFSVPYCANNDYGFIRSNYFGSYTTSIDIAVVDPLYWYNSQYEQYIYSAYFYYSNSVGCGVKKKNINQHFMNPFNQTETIDYIRSQNMTYERLVHTLYHD